MQKEETARFIVTKIDELQSALFFPETPDHLIPTCIINKVQTDEQDQVWFVISCMPGKIDPDTTNFPCKMDFFRKGAGFHLKIKGVASIVSEPGKTGCPLPLCVLEQSAENKNLLIIKVKIQQAHYFEIPALEPARKINNGFLSVVSNAFHRLSNQFVSKDFPEYSAV